MAGSSTGSPNKDSESNGTEEEEEDPVLAVSLDPEGLLDGKWCKIPEALFDELLTALQNEEERIQPTRQELVSYGQTVADNLEKFLLPSAILSAIYYLSVPCVMNILK